VAALAAEKAARVVLVVQAALAVTSVAPAVGLEVLAVASVVRAAVRAKAAAPEVPAEVVADKVDLAEPVARVE